MWVLGDSRRKKRSIEMGKRLEMGQDLGWVHLVGSSSSSGGYSEPDRRGLRFNSGEASPESVLAGSSPPVPPVFAARWRLRLGAGQVPRNRGDRHPGLENQAGLDGEGGLVVEDLAPEAGDHELGDDHVNEDSRLGVSPQPCGRSEPGASSNPDRGSRGSAAHRSRDPSCGVCDLVDPHRCRDGRP